MSDVLAILGRLVHAREKAGLSQGQVAKIFDRDPRWFEGAERGVYPLSLERFLKLCEIYGVSEIWVLTGVNPYFDPRSVVEAAEYQGMPSNELGDLLEVLAMQRQTNEP